MDGQNLLDPRPVDGALYLALIRLAAMSFHVLVSLISVMGTLFHRVLLQQNRLNVNPSGIIEPLLLPAVSSLEDTPVMGFKEGEFSKP